jgi:hypothetical protein
MQATSHKNKRGDAESLRKQGFTVYRWFKDVPPNLATATALNRKGLKVTDETPVADYVLSGDAGKRYCLFRVDDPTLKPIAKRR